MPEYKKRIADLLNEDELLEMEFAISCDPEAHPVIPETGGVRKARRARTGKGKSGGVRVIYFYVGHRAARLHDYGLPKEQESQSLQTRAQRDV
jgi:hypothetical protein